MAAICNDADRPKRPLAGRHELISASLNALVDDPYRSFAGAVREAGGFSKPPEPFQEFLWANFFRDHMEPKRLKRDWDKAVGEALELARSKNAKHIPGWCGPK